MQEFEITLELTNENTEKIIVKKGETFYSLAKKYQKYYEEDIILAKWNGKLVELNKQIKASGVVSFVTVGERDGRRTYRRSVTLVMQRAVEKVYGKEVCVQILYSLGEGDYCELSRYSSDNSKQVKLETN